MTTTTSTRPSPHTPWTSHSHTHSRSHQRPTTTPLGPPTRTPASVGQSIPPMLSAKPRSPSKQHDLRAPSPNYFGRVVEATVSPGDSVSGGHFKGNRSPPSSFKSATLRSPKAFPLESNPDFEAFRRQSETNPFSLSHGNLSHFSLGSSSSRTPTLGSLARDNETRQSQHVKNSQTDGEDPNSTEEPFDDQPCNDGNIRLDAHGPEQKDHSVSGASSFFDLPETESPMSVPSPNPVSSHKNQLSHLHDRHSRLSLPQNTTDHQTPSSDNHLHRADTLPALLDPGAPVMITPQNLTDLLKICHERDLLLLDLRVSPQYAQSRINGAMNLCIPTTLLKRPSFNVRKLAETFAKEKERVRFSHWMESKYIVVYDASATQLKDAVSCVNTLKKFSNQGWQGASYIIRGGFTDFSKKYPDLIDKKSSNEMDGSQKSNLSIDSGVAGVMPVAGGCPMPSTKTAANPFFGNIRQNMDLIGGVGQISVKHPAALTDRSFVELPKWLREASDTQDQGKKIADRFLRIEKAEQKRMQQALSGNVSYGLPTTPGATKTIQIAGIEKGTKNRYKDMLPYDHSRVKLQNVPSGGCDYVNASHVKAEWSHRHYIASQAPVPATFEDFWRVVWEQDARVIVMLTAESEGGQRKSHPYWLSNEYGPFCLKYLSEDRVPLESFPKLSPSRLASPTERINASRRRATNPFGSAVKDATRETPNDSESPFVIVRRLTISHAAYPFQSLREITQLQYSSWPDFGAPAHPAHVLGLVEHCESIIRNYAGPSGKDPSSPAKEGEKPVVVHCSAGCGRTGTFCTVDSVLDMLKRQKIAKKARDADDMEIDEDDWVTRDDIDLVAKSVEDFRLQRLSMVQTLRQFVLCYESVLEWLVNDMPEKIKKDGLRLSYQG